MRTSRLLSVLLVVGVACGGKSSRGNSPRPSQTSTVSAPAVREFTVDVGGRTLWGLCQGEASLTTPTIVLEAGNGNDHTQLAPVADALKQHGLVCSYHRAGLGQSDPPQSARRALGDVVADLHSVLVGAHIPPPYLLVGHSMGGDVVLLYAQRYPAQVAGIVSMNPGPPYSDWLRRLRPIVTAKELLTNEIRPENGLDGGIERVVVRETDDLLDKPFPRGIPYTIMYAEDCAGGTDPYCNRVVGQLQDASRALATLTSEGRFVHVEGAGHEIFATDLDKVLGAINEIVRRAT